MKGEAGTKPKLTLYKGTEEKLIYGGDLADGDAVLKWTAENRVPAFGQINEDNFEIYVESAKKGRRVVDHVD